MNLWTNLMTIYHSKYLTLASEHPVSGTYWDYLQSLKYHLSSEVSSSLKLYFVLYLNLLSYWLIHIKLLAPLCYLVYILRIFIPFTLILSISSNPSLFFYQELPNLHTTYSNVIIPSPIHHLALTSEQISLLACQDPSKAVAVLVFVCFFLLRQWIIFGHV